METLSGWLLGIAFIVMLVLGGIYYAHQKSDCDARHGVLVKSASGFYECVAAPPTAP